MPLGLFLSAALLAIVATTALFSGKIAVAGICLCTLLVTVINLQDRSRNRTTGLHGVAWRATQVESRTLANGGVLVAMIHPEERPHLSALIAEARLFSEVLVVLAIGSEPSSSHAVSELLSAEADRLGGEQDPMLLAALESMTSIAGRPITLMSAVGVDPAYSALEIARLVCPSHLVVVCAADTSPNEQRRRAILIWESLRLPRPAVRVQMVSTVKEETLTFNLDSATKPLIRRTRG